MNQFELVVQPAARVEHFVTKNVLFSVHPKVRKAFLSTVQDFSQVAECSFLVKNPVGFAKLGTIGARGAVGLEDLAESFQLLEKPFAGTLSVFRVQVILVVLRALPEVVRHHYRVFQQQEVRGAAELFKLG